MSGTRTGSLAGEPKLQLRPASIEDARRFFDWVNSPDSLAHKLKTGKAVEWETHHKWFETRLQNRDELLAVVELDGRPVGQVRLEKRTDGHHIDIYIIPQARKAGNAARALRRALEMIKSRPIVATVLIDNEASHRLFRRIGFIESFRDSKITIYKLDE